MIRTQTGRLSRTQALQMVAGLLQTVNVSAFVVFGLPVEYVAFGTMLITALQSGITMYLRTVTIESMK